MTDLTAIVLSYSAIFGSIAFYMIFLGRRSKQLSEEVESLRKQLDRRETTES